LKKEKNTDMPIFQMQIFNVFGENVYFCKCAEEYDWIPKNCTRELSAKHLGESYHYENQYRYKHVSDIFYPIHCEMAKIYKTLNKMKDF
jgi:hypothetical protein